MKIAEEIVELYKALKHITLCAEHWDYLTEHDPKGAEQVADSISEFEKLHPEVLEDLKLVRPKKSKAEPKYSDPFYH